MWERTLQDLIRGLRANKKDEAKFISLAINEIRQEIKSKDMELKAGAVLKLTYLDMMGYDMSWASFHVVEVMSSPKIHLKTVGYLAACQSFQQDTDVLMLTSNLLKKDLSSKPEDVAVTLNGLSHIVTPDLARDLAHDLIAMLNHSRPHIRKRAVIALYKVFVKYPEVTSYGIGRLKEKLDDTDPGVVAATVNVLCELVYRHPQDYLSLAPQLFHLLTTSSNNWMLIKIIKLFGALTPYEPRLVKKLQPPITDLISTTPAISLLYECVHTCITGGMLQGLSGNSLARTCVAKLAGFLQDPDQNLKYISLLAMVKIVPTHPELVAEYQDMILSSVDDQDISIRMRALDLLSAMVSRSNLQPIVQQLLSHLVRSDSGALPSATIALSQHGSNASAITTKTINSPSHSPAYRLTLSQRILELCSKDMYDNIVDFEWYLSVLVDLAYVAGVNVGTEIRDQLVDVTGRVRAARRYSVQLMVKLLSDDAFLFNAKDEGSCAEVLWAAAWICGEYCGELAEPQKLLTYMLQPSIVLLDAEIIAIYLLAAMKVFGYWAVELAERWDNEDLTRVKEVVEMVVERSSAFAANADIEVQERAANMLQLFTFIRADLAAYRPRGENGIAIAESAGTGFESSSASEPNFPKSLFLIQPLFNSFELNAVAKTAQASVPIPDGLDLDAWIVPPPTEEHTILAEESGDDGKSVKKKSRKGKAKEGRSAQSHGKKRVDREGNGHSGSMTPGAQPVETDEALAARERLKAERLERMRDDPYYIVDDRPSRQAGHDIDSIPVVRLDDLPPMPQAPNPRLPSLRNTPSPMTPPNFVIDKAGEMPEGAVRSATQAVQGRASPASFGGSATVTVPQSFVPYEVEDEVARTATPPPIMVTRAKKKGLSSGKKKRTADSSNTITS